MGDAPVNTDDRILVEQDNHMCFKQKDVGNEVTGKGHSLRWSQDDESRVHAVAEDANIVPEEEIQVHNELQLIPQQQSQGPTVCWERFLPVRSLKVLLVENDDSTRQVVSALLRNCSYEVTAVSNGFQAWKILEDLSNHIDIILTEVVMPFISGIALLCKIRSHQTFKDIPVVMTSSHDSMGIVFKCLSRGAVDFLVKPIRKNELKNLWQHVWRRCQSSCSSGSESGTQSKKLVEVKSVDEPVNHTVSSDEQDDRSKDFDIRNGSDDDSDIQSPWTKRAAEIDSPDQVSVWEQSTDAPDSTCAQVIHIKPEAIVSIQVHVTETKERQERDQQPDLDVKVSSPSKLQLEYKHEKVSAQPTTRRQNVSPEVDSKPFDGLMEQNSELISGKMKAQDRNGSSEIVDSANPQIASRTFNGPSGLSIISKLNDKVKCDPRELPSLELSSKRPSGGEDTGNGEHDDCTVLRHSNLSAFSKYTAASSSSQGLTGNVGSCSPLDNSSVAMKIEIMQNFPSHLNSTPPNQQSNESSNNNGMASVTHNCCTGPPQQPPIGKDDDVRVDTTHDQPIGLQQQVQVQHHHYYHHFHHHVHGTEQHQQGHDDETSLKNMADASPQCGSSNAFGGLIKGNTGNISVNGSASGSNQGSNGQNGGSTALNAEPLNVESDIGVAGNNEDGGGISGRISADAGEDDENEAPLHKFRQKRKERSFQKRVRYCNSRKKLMEQKSRVQGQFVRQIVSNSNSSEDNQSNDHDSEDSSGDGIQYRKLE